MRGEWRKSGGIWKAEGGMKAVTLGIKVSPSETISYQQPLLTPGLCQAWRQVEGLADDSLGVLADEKVTV